jgi:fructose-bisphosphate aldolase class I
VWQAVFEAAFVQGVSQESMLLKTNMVLPGYDCAEQASPEHIAERTVASLSRHVPPAVPGIVFLSGGQSEETATVNLDAINRRGGHPWELSFSFGRALQASALLARAEATGAARSGTYRAASAATAGAAP